MKAWKFLALIPTLFLLVPVSVDSNYVAAREDNQIEDTTATNVTKQKDLSAFHPSAVRLGNAKDYTPPNFDQIVNAGQRKEAFYDYLLPMIHKANQEVILERQWLAAMSNKLLKAQTLTVHQLGELEKFEKRYAIRLRDPSVAKRVGTLLLHVDVVPASLIVAQAAKESGWGTSRFATEGNNFFGIWCFYQGCGLKPLRRDVGRAHEVATFASVEQGVRYYVRTINTHVAYDDLRDLRANSRRQELFIQGEDLANGLILYSERGSAYVQEVQSMIRYNKMQRFTRVYSV